MTKMILCEIEMHARESVTVAAVVRLLCPREWKLNVFVTLLLAQFHDGTRAAANRQANLLLLNSLLRLRAEAAQLCGVHCNK